MGGFFHPVLVPIDMQRPRHEPRGDSHAVNELMLAMASMLKGCGTREKAPHADAQFRARGSSINAARVH